MNMRAPEARAELWRSRRQAKGVKTDTFVYRGGAITDDGDPNAVIQRSVGQAWSHFKSYIIQIYDHPDVRLDAQGRSNRDVAVGLRDLDPPRRALPQTPEATSQSLAKTLQPSSPQEPHQPPQVIPSRPQEDRV